MNSIDGNTIVYCEGAFNTPNGKTAHGLVRFTKRYNVLAVIDSRYAGNDAGMILDKKEKGIPILGGFENALNHFNSQNIEIKNFVVGLAPDGGRLSAEAKADVRKAVEAGLNVDSGLHDFLTEDKELMLIAAQKNIRIRDIRKPLERNKLHFFEGKIDKVNSLKIALLGTDSAVGKRTTAWVLVNGLNKRGIKAELIGTGQTAWMQGAKYSLVMDSIVNDFVSGEIEHAVYEAWVNENPEVIVIEGQGSIMNPAYPGGFEILAAGRPDAVVMQHAPARKDYDGFPGYKLHPLGKQIEVIHELSGKPVVAVTINHEDLNTDEIPALAAAIENVTGIPAVDVLVEGDEKLVNIILKILNDKKDSL